MAAPSLTLKFQYGNAYSLRENSIPVFLRCQGVKGELSVENGAQSDIEKIKIILKGTMYNNLSHHNDCASCFEPHRLTVKETLLNLVEAHDWPADDTITNTEPANTTESFAFDFPLHRKPWTADEDCDNYPQHVLPSSVSATGYGCRVDNNRFSCSASTQVRYELQAYAYKGDEIVAQVISSITIYDTENPNPSPIFQEHFQGEYVCDREKRLKKLGMYGSTSLSMAIDEPKPVEIGPQSKNGQVMAALPIKFILQSNSRRAGKLDAIPFHIDVKSALKVSTYLSVGKMRAHPTIAASQGSPFLSALTRHTNRSVRNLTVRGWKPSKNIAGSKPDQITWTNNVELLIPISGDGFPAPSFFTPYIARRYSLQLWFEVSSSWGEGTFRFNVPIQVVYPETPVMYDRIYDSDQESEESWISEIQALPVYIR